MNATTAARAETKAAEGPENRADRQSRARGPAMLHRLMMIHELLVSGATPEEALAQAQLKWGIGRRSALLYLRRVRKRLIEVNHREDRAYVQQIGLAQRGRVLGKVLSCLREVDPTEPTSVPIVTQLANVAAKLIDARDRSAIAAEASETNVAPPTQVAHVSRTTRAIVMTTHNRNGQELLEQTESPRASLTSAEEQEVTTIQSADAGLSAHGNL